MASQRLTRASLDAIIEARARQYLDRSDAVDEVLHQLRVHSRPVTRTQYDEEEEEFQDGGRFIRGDWGKDSRSEYSLPSYRSSSHVTEEEDYFSKSSTKLPSRNQDYGQLTSYDQDCRNLSPVERDYAGPSSRDWDYDDADSREWKYSHTPLQDPYRHRETDFASLELLDDFRSTELPEENYRTAYSQNYDLEQGLETEREFSSTLNIGRGRGPQGKRGMATRGLVRSKWKLAAHPKKWATKALSPADDLLNPLGPTKRRKIPSLLPQKNKRPVLASPKKLQQERTLKPTVQIKKPDLELLDSSNVLAKAGIEIIKWAGFCEIKSDPYHSELFRLLFTSETEACAKTVASFKCLLKTEHQDSCMSSFKMLKHPALKTPKVDRLFLNLLLEKKVMVAANIFFEVITPFDRYIMRLQDYLLKSTTPLLMACNACELRFKTNRFSDSEEMATAFQSAMSLCRKSLVRLGQTFALASTFRQEKILEALGIPDSAPSATLFPNYDTSALFGKEYIETLQSWLEKSGSKMQLKRPDDSPPAQAPQRADKKVVGTIEKLVNVMVSGKLTGKQKAELKQKPEYWFLLEEDSLEYKYYKLKLDETKRAGNPQGAASALKAEKSTIGTQTVSSARLTLKQEAPHTPMSSPDRDKSDSDQAETLSLKETSRKTDSVKLSEDSQSLMSQFPDVDPKVMVTAQKLAEFVAEVGPEIEQFSIENSADNPDLSFLKDPESSAFKFYRMKVHELCPSMSFSGGQESGDLHERSEAKESERGNLEEEEEEEEDEEEEEEEEEEETPQAEMENEEGDEEEGPTKEPEEAIVEEKLMKVEHSKTAEKEGETSNTAASGLSKPPAKAPTQGAPIWRKRITGKALKVGLIPASKRVCLVDEPKVHDPVRIPYDRPRGYSAYKHKKNTMAGPSQEPSQQSAQGALQPMSWEDLTTTMQSMIQASVSSRMASAVSDIQASLTTSISKHKTPKRPKPSGIEAGLEVSPAPPKRARGSKGSSSLVLPEPSDEKEGEAEDPPEVVLPSDTEEGPSNEEGHPLHKRTVHLFTPNCYPKVFQDIVSTLGLQRPKVKEASTSTPSSSGCGVESVFPVPQEPHPGFPLPPSFQKTIDEEWASPFPSHVLKSCRMHYMRFYKLSEDHAPRFRQPVVDAPLVTIGAPYKKPLDSMKFPQNTLDKRVELSGRRSFEASSGALRASVAASLACQAIVLWCQQFSDQFSELPTAAQADLRKIGITADFAANASSDSVQLSARAMASSVAIRRSTWLRNWDMDNSAHGKLVSLPFRGSKLFGEDLDPFLETRGKQKVLPSRPKRKAAFSYCQKQPLFLPQTPTEPSPFPNFLGIQRPIWQPQRPINKPKYQQQPRPFPPRLEDINIDDYQYQ